MQLTRKNFLTGALSFSALLLSGGMTAGAVSKPATRDKGMARGLTLLTIVHNGEPRLAVKTDKGILDVVEAAKILRMSAPSTTDELLQNEQGPALNALVDAALKSNNQRLFVAESSIVFGPAVTRPERIICVGLNYRAHAKAIGLGVPRMPVLFSKFNNALNAHKGTIRLPVQVAKKFDYETEMVMVIGKEAHDVREAEALDYVAGYCTGHDFSARDLQLELDGHQWMVGKTCDGFGPVGPYIVTADQIDPDKLAVECRVNGELCQSGNTSDFIFNSRYLISYISRMMTLRPGDIIFTGTPGGVIAEKPKEQQVWLKAGDKIVCSIEKLGEQTFDLV